MLEIPEKYIQKNKDKIINLLRSTEKANIEALISELENNNYFTQPASIRYHQNYKGGLAEHSLEVYYALSELNEKLNLGYSEDTIIIVALMHDLCKFDNYLEDGFGGYIYNENAIKGHGVKSVGLLEKYIPVDDIEREAIMYHMGAYERKEFDWNDLSAAYRRSALTYYTHVADMRSTYNF